ncbi:MAG TPA: D-alanyl-D-alanine carboxypeptidase family protein [Pseudonocardia sp.]|nr:D-alanyl-D-alanine carboxypeptidase family protein [Pseudonocardia sp.]
MSLAARLVAVVTLVVALAGGPAAASTCPGAQVPPPPPAPAELVAPAPAPLPWPAEPVGGPRLGACGDVATADAPPPPQVGAAAWVLADLDSGAVLAARAPHARHRPASTLKVLTAVVALDRLDPEAVVEGTAADLRIEGSRAGIGPGGRYTVRQLLAALLLNSGNDAANALARAMGGPEPTVAAMNRTARELGALDTRAATPSGLDGPGQATSAYDLALLVRAALRDPVFADLLATRGVDFPGHGGLAGFRMSNSSDLLLRYPGSVGSKSGFTEASRHTLVAAAQRDGRRLVVTLVRGEQRPVPMWRQAAALLDHGFALPTGTSPVGRLVEGAPRPVPGGPSAPVTPAGPETTPAPGAVGAEPPAEGSRGPLPVALPVLLDGAVVAALVLRSRHR